MWWFSSSSRLRRLEERVEKLEADLRSGNLDWDELYQKCRKLLGRTVKERETITAHAGEDGAGTPDLQAGVPGARFSPKQVAIQQQILRRRAGL